VIAVDKAEKLGELIADLRRDIDHAGGGKRIASGFAYWGVAPTNAWCNACNDRYYPVMRVSIASFGSRFGSLFPSLNDRPFHYVSLGSGTGDKDMSILRELQRVNGDACYVPVDLSSEMLRIGVQKATRDIPLTIGLQVIPVQLDFSESRKLTELRLWLDEVFGDEAVLFSLLGNTLANFDDDTQLLRDLSHELLRPKDRLLLEVATTSTLSDRSARLAAKEYKDSSLFYHWVVSALQQYTDLTIKRDLVSYTGTVEPGRALRVTIAYENRTDPDMRLLLPDLDSIAFPQGDTIRLDLTRKYLAEELGVMIAASELSVVDSDPSALRNSGESFGLELVLLERDRQREQREDFASTKIWRKP